MLHMIKMFKRLHFKPKQEIVCLRKFAQLLEILYLSTSLSLSPVELSCRVRNIEMKTQVCIFFLYIILFCLILFVLFLLSSMPLCEIWPMYIIIHTYTHAFWSSMYQQQLYTIWQNCLISNKSAQLCCLPKNSFGKEVQFEM